jgi:hypothetical protein
MKLSVPGALLLTTAVVLGLGACGDGGGNGSSLPSDRPTVDRSVTRTPDEATETPADDRTGRPTRTEDAAPTTQPPATRTQPPPTQPPQTTTRPEPAPTTAQPPPTQAQPTRGEAVPPAQPPAAATPPASNVAAEPASTDVGDVGCLLLILLVGLVVGGLVIWRQRRGSDWDVEASTLVGATTAGLNRLPAVLVTTTIGERALVWPPLRDDLGALMGSWDVLASGTGDAERRDWAVEVRTRLQDLVFAIDQENEVLAADREWQLLRPRVAAAAEALAATLAARPGTAPAGRPAYAQAQTGYPAGGPGPVPPAQPGQVSPAPAGYRPGQPRHGSPPEPPAAAGPAGTGYPAEPPEPPTRDYPSEPPGPGPEDPPDPPDHARHRA